MALQSIKNRVGMTVTSVSATPSTGTGTITLNAADTGHQSFATAYAADANVDILIEEGNTWEIARDCTYTNTGTTVTRGTLEASSTGAAVVFTSAAKVYVVNSAARIQRGAEQLDLGLTFVGSGATVTQSIAATTWTKVAAALDTVNNNPNTWWDTVNKRFTPTRAGTYFFTVALQWNSGANVGQVALYKNGAIDSYGVAMSNAINCTHSGPIYLNGSTDYVELYAYTSAANTNLAGANRVTFKAFYEGL